MEEGYHTGPSHREAPGLHPKETCYDFELLPMNKAYNWDSVRMICQNARNAEEYKTCEKPGP